MMQTDSFFGIPFDVIPDKSVPLVTQFLQFVVDETEFALCVFEFGAEVIGGRVPPVFACV